MPAISFMSPSQRAASSDLTVAVSPLGLIELSDEEFEVHGPRLNRYAQAWAFYLGHHWSYREKPGEPQLTFNYSRALSDWIVNFTFGKGINFQVDPEFQHITPALLDRVWNTDNNQQQVLWEIGNQGSVQGDVFVKVAYEPAWTDSGGMAHPGRVRILPLNASFCFPEWHPHDRERMVRFKLKYRFWGTSLEGTRQVYTYVEIITDDWIEEYVDDQLIDRRPNPLGVIPVVHIANKQASASPWGLSDIIDVVPLNRTYNETATYILDIINYYTAPVTVVTGFKVAGLERGANKAWGIPNKDAKVYNLEGGAEGLPQALEYLSILKVAMHEMAAVPETALGQAQPISNTSGVALSIQFQPTMMAFAQKKTQYGEGLRRINKLVLRTLFTFEPDTVYYNPNTDGIMQDGQAPMLYPSDPEVYHTEPVWESPLPVDTLIALNEIQVKLALGLESRKGALRDLGEKFPDEKQQELFEEQIVDAKMDAARRILNAHIDSVIVALTGIVPEGGGEPVDGAQTQETKTRKPDGTTTTQTKETKPGVEPLPGISGLPGIQDLSTLIQGMGEGIFNDVVTQAYGTKLPQRRIVDENQNSS